MIPIVTELISLIRTWFLTVIQPLNTSTATYKVMFNKWYVNISNMTLNLFEGIYPFSELEENTIPTMNSSSEWKILFTSSASHDIHFASITKQIKLVFEMSLLVFAKTNFFQISQIEYLQIQIFTNISNLLNYNHKYKIKNKTLVILQIIGPQ